MKLDIVAGNKNDEYYTPFYAIKPLIKYINKADRIWCPFDTQDSIIYKSFLNRGYQVDCSHINTGEDFFITHKDCDIIISNPPYSLKTKVFENLFQRNVKFAMLVGVVGIFEGPRFNIFKDRQLEIMFMNKRIDYLLDYNDLKPASQPPFSSTWICSGVLPRQIVFEEINKKEINDL